MLGIEDFLNAKTYNCNISLLKEAGHWETCYAFGRESLAPSLSGFVPAAG